MLRRAHEAAWVQRRSRPLAHDLQRKVAADAVRAGERRLADEGAWGAWAKPVSYTHLRAHETSAHL
eukprot:6735501-Alexandrium_andersonii.AAC.1